MTAFYGRWRDYPLVVDKWFRLQALSPLPGALARVQSLTLHPAYHKENPNRVRALVGAFCHGNPGHFHADDGSGYLFLSDQVLQIDPINPQVAARLVSAFNQWRRYDDHRQRLMQAELERIQGQDGVSRDVGEIVGRTLAAG
jgi:aminopeptidase N